jgi:hypothetical protein
LILIDTHVHIYNCFDLRVFFDAAACNFKNAASVIAAGQKFSSVLVLTDWAGKNWFRKLAVSADSGGSEGVTIENWACSPTHDSSALYFSNKNGDGFYIIAGRKIITAENLEVLALATDDPDYPDGLGLIETVKYIQSHDSIACVPWAVGKWLGERGQVLDELISTLDPKDYFLCDNSNRPFFWPRPSQFSVVEARGGRILSGSDPLHFPSESNRAGSFGCWVEGKIDSDQPAKQLKTILGNHSLAINLYGRLETPFRFFKNQISMQLLKRKWQREFYNS